MQIWLLGPSHPQVEACLASLGDTVSRTEAPLPALAGLETRPDFLVSYGYRHIIGPDWVAAFPRRIVNLHIAYLPWNRGAAPNLWSILEDTPKGVSLHFIDSGLDTGALIAQRRVEPRAGDTLATSYARLIQAVEALLAEVWLELRAGRIEGTPQPAGGTLHRLRDQAAVAPLLTNGWDTPLEGLRAAYLEMLENNIHG